MLFGEPPFLCADKKQLFKKIVTERVKIDKRNLTPEAVDLLKGLLEKNPLKRLGADSITKVKDHVFFNDTDWDSVLKRKEKMNNFNTPSLWMGFFYLKNLIILVL